MDASADRKKRPASQFYWGDWLRDTALRSCSIAARGLWMDMLCYMHEGQPYGHLCLNGKQITVPVLARMVGESPARVKSWLAELDAAGVPGQTPDGTYFCRRMVRDEHNRNVRAAGGALSLGKPNVPQPKHGRIPSAYPSPPSIGVSPASASASASAVPPPNGGGGGADAPTAQPLKLHGRRNPDLLTHGPIKLWASQFRDEILPLVATHFGGDRDAAYGPALAWVGEVDTANLTTTPSRESLAKPKDWWSTQARERWGVAQSVADDPWLKAGNP